MFKAIQLLSLGLTLSALGETTSKDDHAKGDCNCSSSANSRASEVTSQKVISLNVSGMSCGGCEQGLTQKLKKLDSVVSVDKVSHTEKTVSLTVSAGTCQTVIEKAITDAGYHVVAVENADTVKK